MLYRDAGMSRAIAAVSAEMDRLFDTLAGGPGGPSSAPVRPVGRVGVNAWETDESFVIELEAPGFRREDLSLEFTGGALTIRGERTIARPEGARVLRAERGSGAFERTLRVRAAVDPEGVTASLDGGVLTVTLPKAAEARPRRIEIAPAGDAPAVESA